MRLFTGIELAETARATVAAMAEELQRRVRAAAPRSRITWVAPERLHLTIRFIGEVDGARAEQIIGALREPIRVAPFVITLDRLGAFPASGPPRVFWIGIATGRDPVLRVESEISSRLRAIGIADEERPYSPHVTLARVREPAGLRGSKLLADVPPVLAETQVHAVTLFQSRTSPKGPTYVTLQRTPLFGGGPRAAGRSGRATM